MTQHIAVIDYRTAVLRYRGPSEWEAAKALEPGTVFGKGATANEAFDQAMRRVAALQGALKN